jgi:hypothetical protein
LTETFLWDQHFATGLEIVDQQHHRRGELINQLENCAADVNTSDDGATATFAERPIACGAPSKNTVTRRCLWLTQIKATMFRAGQLDIQGRKSELPQ